MRLISNLLAIVGFALASLSLTMSFSTGQDLDLKANMDSPGSYCSSGGGMAERTVWVLSDKPLRLALLGNSKPGNELRCSQSNWQQTSKGYLTQVSFPISYVSQFPRLRLVREDGKGWSDWNQDHGSNEMAYLRNQDVPKSNPACVGGRAWCATRGL